MPKTAQLDAPGVLKHVISDVVAQANRLLIALKQPLLSFKSIVFSDEMGVLRKQF